MKTIVLSLSVSPLVARAAALLLAGALFFAYAGSASANNIPHPGTKPGIQAPSTSGSSAGHSSNIEYKSGTGMSLSPEVRAQMQNSLSNVKAALEGIQDSVSTGSANRQAFGNTAARTETEKEDSEDRIDQYRAVIAELRSVVEKLTARIEALEKNR